MMRSATMNIRTCCDRPLAIHARCPVCGATGQTGYTGPQRRDYGLLARLPPRPGMGAPIAPMRSKTSKAEAEWGDILKHKTPNTDVAHQGITVRFADGTRYTPDWVVWYPDRMACYEIKGGYRGPGWEQGMERYRRARDRFPALHLKLATKTKQGWEVTE